MRKPYIALPSTQHGATLIIALLILVMIIMYGIPAAMDSIQNEHMAGNTRNRDLAFQAAEHALKRAETWLNLNYSSVDTLTPTTNAANDVAYWREFDWTSSGVNTSIDSDLGVADQPRYVVERMPDVSISGSITHYYRITARGVGKDSNAIVILQTMYERTEP